MIILASGVYHTAHPALNPCHKGGLERLLFDTGGGWRGQCGGVLWDLSLQG